jgi:hypothetical protein
VTDTEGSWKRRHRTGANGIADAVQVNVLAVDHDLLAGRVLHHAPRNHLLRAPYPLVVEVAPLVDAQRPEIAPVRPEQIGHHRKVGALDTVEDNCRPVFLETKARDAVDLPARVDLLADVHHILLRLEEREKFAHVVPLPLAHAVSFRSFCD